MLLQRAVAPRITPVRANLFKIMQEIRRTVQIKLRHTPEQAEEIEQLYAAFKIGLNFSLKQIEDTYQKTMKKYTRIAEVDGVCSGCGKDRSLTYSLDGKRLCNSCVMREYSEYTVRGTTIGTTSRPSEHDIKKAVDIENKTHVHMMFAQAYGTWRSFNTWRNKREFERKRLETDLKKIKENDETREVYRAATEIWQRAAQIQREREKKKITRLRAMAMASKEIYAQNPELSQRDISRIVNKLRELNYLKRPLHFPEYETVSSIQMHKNFVQFKEGKLHVSLFHKKNNGQVMDFYRNEYLNQFLSEMEEDNAVYTNLVKKMDGKKIDYYMMYPLTVKKNIPTVLDLADMFTICFSPDRVLVYSQCNGSGEKFKFFRLGKLLRAKGHFSNKRAELMEHNTRGSHRRVKKMGNVERRFTRTFNHQLSHKIVEYIADKSENPLIVMWDMTSGITADYGKRLNRIKKLWPVVQQQDFIQHKSFLRCVPVKMIQYSKANNLTCSFCHKPYKKKDELGKPTKDAVKSITALLRRARNIKCESCGHELNLLINQARNLSALAAAKPESE